MKHVNLSKTLGTALLIGGTIAAASAIADPPQRAYGTNGMGPGMMGGYGAGYGMTGGYAPGPGLNLNAEQRSKIARIQDDVRRKHWDLMGKMQDEQALMNEQYGSDKRDDATISKGYRKMSEFRHQMFDLSLSAQRQIDAVLSKEQREK